MATIPGSRYRKRRTTEVGYSYPKILIWIWLTVGLAGIAEGDGTANRSKYGHYTTLYCEATPSRRRCQDGDTIGCIPRERRIDISNSAFNFHRGVRAVKDRGTEGGRTLGAFQTGSCPNLHHCPEARIDLHPALWIGFRVSALGFPKIKRRRGPSGAKARAFSSLHRGAEALLFYRHPSLTPSASFRKRVSYL